MKKLIGLLLICACVITLGCGEPTKPKTGGTGGGGGGGGATHKAP